MKIFKLFILLVLLSCVGCCSLITRSCTWNSYTKDVYGRKFTVYAATKDTWRALGAPYRVHKHSTNDPIGDSIETIIWPIILIDLPFESVFDTVFLPYDYYAVCRNEREKK